MTVPLGNVWFSQGYCEGKEVVFVGNKITTIVILLRGTQRY